jgi:hypothetical protein
MAPDTRFMTVPTIAKNYLVFPVSTYGPDLML